jgi:hypothetical protein
VAYLQKAIENTAFPDDAHYRLAQAYRRMAETEKAQQETERYKLALEKKNQPVEQEAPRAATIRLHTSRTARSRAQRVSPKNRRPSGTPVGRRLK